VFDLLSDLELFEQVSLYKTPMPYPLHEHFLYLISKNHEKILILEETDPVIELQLPERKKVFGRLNGFIPKEGEITPDIIYPLINEFLTNSSIKKRKLKKKVGQRPSLCPGCPHRASFFAIKKALPNAIYPSDIGCYTLGINLGAVDTCLCMGASINQASGFYQSIKKSKSKNKPIVATIGDSTFLHSGIPAIINSVYNNARFILVILDNHTTAMTGNQPTAATGILPDGTLGTSINIEKLLEGCGIKFIKVIDPYDIPQFISILKDAYGFTTKKDGGIAVIIARHSCLMNKDKPKAYPVTISSECTGCHYCIKNFECPALVPVENQVTINQVLCTGCGVCEYICPIKAIQVKR
jgi:indolepyruvate ferredoxin oxidoreductase alpha subunit